MASPSFESYISILIGLLAVTTHSNTSAIAADLTLKEPNQKTDYHIAVLLPRLSPKPSAIKWKFSSNYVAPAVQLALDRVHSMSDLMPRGLRLKVKYRDSKCDAAESVNNAIKFFTDHEVDIFFGPCCDYAAAPIARQTRYWEIPMVTAGAMAREYGISKATEFPMLTRVGGNFNSLTQFVLERVIMFGWHKMKMVYDPQGHGTEMQKFCHLTVDCIHQAILTRPEYQTIKQDYFKILSQTEFTEKLMQKEIGREYGSK